MGAEMNEREALKLALEGLDCIFSPLHVREITKVGNAMKAIKEALAQPEQEPVAWKHPDKNMVFWEDTKEVDEYHGFKPTIPLYPHPQRIWVGLTDAEKHDCYLRIDIWNRCYEMIEAKLREKNT